MDSLNVNKNKLTIQLKLILAVLIFTSQPNFIFAQGKFFNNSLPKSSIKFEYSNGRLFNKLLFTNDSIPQSEFDEDLLSKSMQHNFTINYSRRIKNSSSFFNLKYNLQINSMHTYFYNYYNIGGSTKIMTSGSGQIILNNAIAIGILQHIKLNNKFIISPIVNFTNMFGASDTSVYHVFFGETEVTTGFNKNFIYKVGIEAGVNINYNFSPKFSVFATAYYTRQFSDSYTYIIGERVIGTKYPWLIYGSKQNLMLYGIGISFNYY